MQFVIEPPQQLEVAKVEIRTRALISTPVTLKGQHIVKAVYLTAKGDGGAASKAVVLFNANTGEFSIQRIDGEPVKFHFDLPKGEFANKRHATRRSGRLGGLARARKAGDAGNATAD